ncbi:type II toxin-antitoxin system RelE family toxin, partial [Cronobacter sakazakii]
VKLACRQARYRLRVGDYRVIFERRQGVPVICLIMEVKRRTTTTYLN